MTRLRHFKDVLIPTLSLPCSLDKLKHTFLFLFCSLSVGQSWSKIGDHLSSLSCVTICTNKILIMPSFARAILLSAFMASWSNAMPAAVSDVNPLAVDVSKYASLLHILGTGGNQTKPFTYGVMFEVSTLPPAVLCLNLAK